MTKEVGEACS